MINCHIDFTDEEGKALIAVYSLALSILSNQPEKAEAKRQHILSHKELNVPACSMMRKLCYAIDPIAARVADSRVKELYSGWSDEVPR